MVAFGPASALRICDPTGGEVSSDDLSDEFEVNPRFIVHA